MNIEEIFELSLIHIQMCIRDSDMTESIREETVKMLMHVRIEQKVEREQVAEVTGTNKDDSANAPVVRKSEKISRNAPCPCGSGKKYKYCCGR